MQRLVFIKLGGSLITDKETPNILRPKILDRLVKEIAVARGKTRTAILIGHGSGSFGHVPAEKHQTRQGVSGLTGWRGFVEVYRAAHRLHDFVMQAMNKSDLPAVSFSPSSAALSTEGIIGEWEIGPIRAALAANLIPVVHGDVIFDRKIGGTIVSTEDVFWYLAPRLGADRILITGIEDGVWSDYPLSTSILKEITPGNFDSVAAGIRGSEATDVTGGMSTKVKQMVDLVGHYPKIEIDIFSGNTPGNLRSAITGKIIGTRIHAGID